MRVICYIFIITVHRSALTAVTGYTWSKSNEIAIFLLFVWYIFGTGKENAGPNPDSLFQTDFFFPSIFLFIHTHFYYSFKAAVSWPLHFMYNFFLPNVL